MEITQSSNMVSPYFYPSMVGAGLGLIIILGFFGLIMWLI
jgi:hypothetical protein